MTQPEQVEAFRLRMLRVANVERLTEVFVVGIECGDASYDETTQILTLGYRSEGGRIHLLITDRGMIKVNPVEDN